MRIIPKKTKVNLEFFKGVEIPDLIVGLIGGGVIMAVLLSELPFRMWICSFFFVLTFALLVPLDDQKTYMIILHAVAFLARQRKFTRGETPHSGKKKKTETWDLVPFTGIDGEFIEYGGKYYGIAVHIPSIEFRFLDRDTQNGLIDRTFGAILRTVGMGETALMVKVDRPIVYDDYVRTENQKLDQLKEAYLNGLLSEEELTDRVGILQDRLEQLRQINEKDLVYVPFHYLIFCNQDKAQLRNQAEETIKAFGVHEIQCEILKGADLAVFLKYNFTQNFNEREVKNLTPDQYMDWIVPKELEFAGRTVKIDGLITHNLRIRDYPVSVPNAWGANLFNTMSTKVVLKMTPRDRYRSIRQIDRAIDELREQGSNTGRTSRIMELTEHVKTLQELLRMLQGDNEVLFDVNTYITVFDYELSNALAADKKPDKNKKKDLAARSLKKKIRRQCSEEGFKTNDNLTMQYEAYGASMISAWDPFSKYARGIHSGSIAAAFPYVYNNLCDPGGICIGRTGGIPVFINFFLRNRERVNSNAVIIGKSGSGKSYATKTILTQLAAEDSKIFILDPENEYTLMAKNFNGKIIDVGSATQGRLNPFHIITNLTDDEENDEENPDKDTESVTTSFYVHLQFLEEFYRQILPGIESDPLEYLNNLTVRMYEEKGIDATTDLSKLKPSDFPTFDDLYDKILNDYQKASGEYAKNNLRILISYISKFSAGGRNAALWNGEATISTKENFIVFNFQSLLANKNSTIANAQMLLVLKWLDNEIIKNRDYNMMYHADRKIIIVIDEAHVFIDSKYPIALDFMYQLAKRIRKYNGMQIIITQNIKDFVGTEELERKSTAIINASQYSFIFPLAPNDMNDLCKLYEKSGALNSREQHDIINNGRGRAFVITSPTMRTCVDIQTTKSIEKLFTM